MECTECGAELYDATECYNCELVNVNVQNKDIDMLRDVALESEETDINKAYRLMALAHKLRPSGELIAAKLEEYKKTIVFS